MNRREAFLGAALLAGCAGLPPGPPQRQAAPSVRVIVALEADGRPAPLWLAAIRDRVDASQGAAIAETPKPLSAEEAGWRDLIIAAAPAWSQSISRLNAPFRHVTPPRAPAILLGNQGGGDGFTLDPDDVAIDLGEMARNYAGLADADRRALIQRLLSHEYTHLLLHRWLDATGWSEASVANDPFRQALRTLFNEGIANLRSIEDPVWMSSEGALTAHAQATLTALEPILLARMQALAAHPAPDVAATLLRNISQGPLERKWGAVTIALWLAEATQDDPGRLAQWIEKKPDRLLELGVLYGDPQNRDAFGALLAQARRAAPQ